MGRMNQTLLLQGEVEVERLDQLKASRMKETTSRGRLNLKRYLPMLT